MNEIPLNPNFIPASSAPTPEKIPEHIQQELEYYRNHEAFKQPQFKNLPIKEQVLKSKEIAQQTVPQLPQEHVAQNQPLFQEVQQLLTPESHDQNMQVLFSFLEAHGIAKTLALVEGLHNPHIEDDFHRFLIQYVRAYQKMNGQELKVESRFFEPTHKTLLEITIAPDHQGERASHKTLAATMEQVYTSISSILGETESINFEISFIPSRGQIVFFVAVPKESKTAVEKSIIGFFPTIQIKELFDDTNMFLESGYLAAAEVHLKEHSSYTLPSYNDYETDPLQVIINMLSRLEKETEGATIQITVACEKKEDRKELEEVNKLLQKGKKMKDAIGEASQHAVSKALGSLFLSGDSDDKKDGLNHNDSERQSLLQKKLGHHLFRVSMNLVVCTQNKQKSDALITEVGNSIMHLRHPSGNSYVVSRVPEKSMETFITKFIFREFGGNGKFILSSEELATIFHFPQLSQNLIPEVKFNEAKTAPAPLELSQEGILLGVNSNAGKDTEIHYPKEDRMRHFYAIGQTGTGKTGTLLTMILQDINNGEGVCYIDPHGTDAQTILSLIPPHRIDDVIYFDPANTERPMGLNMLEYDPAFPEQKTLVIDELMVIFNKLFDMKATAGPAFEQYFKNSAMLVMEDPESGSTLLEITRVLGDEAFREAKLAKCKNPIINQFFENAKKAKGEQALENFVPYVTRFFDPFITNEFLRPIILQQKSSINIREIMDQGKILIVNLSKGRLGELNASLIGLVLVNKIQMAALGRAGAAYGQAHKDFYLYLDEFQNVTTPSIASILSEARKYRLSLNVAHQYLRQLDDQIRNAVFGNVGTMAVFRVDPDDAEQLQKRLDPVFTKEDIIKQKNRNAYVSMLSGGVPQRAFNIHTLELPKGNRDNIDKLKELSQLKHGHLRADVEAEIFGRFKRS